MKLCDRCDCVPSVRQQYLYFDNYIDFGTYGVTDVPVDRLHGWFEHQKLRSPLRCCDVRVTCHTASSVRVTV